MHKTAGLAGVKESAHNANSREPVLLEPELREDERVVKSREQLCCQQDIQRITLNLCSRRSMAENLQITVPFEKVSFC